MATRKRRVVKIERGSLVRFRESLLPLSSPKKVIEAKHNLARLEDGIWWPVQALISEQEWQEPTGDGDPA